MAYLSVVAFTLGWEETYKYQDGITPKKVVFAYFSIMDKSIASKAVSLCPKLTMVEVGLSYEVRSSVYEVEAVVLVLNQNMLLLGQTRFWVDIPDSVLAFLKKQEPLYVYDDDLKEKLPPDLYANLRPFQRQAVEMAVQRKKFYIADMMGTGKSITSIATMAFFLDAPDKHALIIAPTILLFNWKRELMQWLHVPEDQIWIVDSATRLKKAAVMFPQARFVITTYILHDRQAFRQHMPKFTCVVFDEAHHLKNPTSQRTMSATGLITELDPPVVLLLSGTPFSYPYEMFSQVRLLYPELFPRYFNYSASELPGEPWSFIHRYAKPRQVPLGPYKSVWDTKGYNRPKEFHAILCHFLIRRRKEQVLTQLPPKQRILFQLPGLDKDKQIEIDDLLQKEKQGQNVEDKNYDNPFAFMETCRLVGQYKIESVLSALQEMFLDEWLDPESTTQVCIFFQYGLMCEALVQLFEKTKEQLPYFYIRGETSKDKRDEYQQDFQAGKYRIALLSFGCCNAGLNFNKASTVIMTEMLFSPSIMIQSEDRAHRMGQEQHVTVYYLHLPKSTDEICWRLVCHKELNSSEMIDGVGSRLGGKKSATLVAVEDGQHDEPVYSHVSN